MPITFSPGGNSLFSNYNSKLPLQHTINLTQVGWLLWIFQVE
jgi:hypothetical protein